MDRGGALAKMNNTALAIKNNAKVLYIYGSSTVQNLIASFRTHFEKYEDKRSEICPSRRFLWTTKIVPLVYHKGRLLFNRANTDISSCFSSKALFPSRSLKNPRSQRCSYCALNNIFANMTNSSKCILIHTILALTLGEESLISLSLQEEKAQNMKLLLAATDLVGSELKQFQVDMQISLSYQKYLCINEVKFSNLKKLRKTHSNFLNLSVLKNWQPEWLRQVDSKASKFIDIPEDSGYEIQWFYDSQISIELQHFQAIDPY